MLKARPTENTHARRLITVHHRRAIRSSASAVTPHLPVTRHEASAEINRTIGEMTMKTIVSAFLALSFLAGAVAPAAADWYDGSVIERLDKEGRGGHNT
jgi:hypothetical protein